MSKEEQMIFRIESRAGKEILRIDDNGDFFINGKLTTNDKEIVRYFKNFFKNAFFDKSKKEKK